MTSNAHESADKPVGMPVVRKIEFSDLTAALSAGAKDFLAAPMFGLFFGGFFALGGLLMVLFIAKLDMHYMIYPLAIAFPLLGPFAAVGLYEVSRDHQTGPGADLERCAGVCVGAKGPRTVDHGIRDAVHHVGVDVPGAPAGGDLPRSEVVFDAWAVFSTSSFTRRKG
jgi:hypothetical protein